MTYKNTFLFIPRNDIKGNSFFGIFLFSSFSIKKMSRSLEALRLQPLGEPPQCFLLPLHPGIKLGYLVNGC